MVRKSLEFKIFASGLTLFIDVKVYFNAGVYFEGNHSLYTIYPFEMVNVFRCYL